MKYYLGSHQPKLTKNFISIFKKSLDGKRVSNQNDANLIYEQLQKNNYSINVDLINRNQIYNVILPSQNLNVNPLRFPIGVKNVLFRLLIDYYTKIKIDPFIRIPKTFDLKNKNDLKLYQKHKELKYLYKPVDSCSGTGIKIYEGEKDAFIQELFNKKPFLMDNKVVCLRIYVLYILENNKLDTYIYDTFLLQKSSIDYDKNNILSLITNYKPKNIKDNDKFYLWQNDLIYNDNKRIPNNRSNYNKIYSQAVNLISDITNSIKDNLKKVEYKSFQNVGFDFLLDDKMNLFLCECNDQYGMQYKNKKNVLNILKQTIELLKNKESNNFIKI